MKTVTASLIVASFLTFAPFAFAQNSSSNVTHEEHSDQVPQPGDQPPPPSADNDHPSEHVTVTTTVSKPHHHHHRHYDSDSHLICDDDGHCHSQN